MRAALGVLIASGMLVAPGVAEAGRSHYGWLFGTEVLPERGAEIQTWIAERNGRNDTNLKETSWFIGALVGVDDRLTLAFPVEFVWLRGNGPATFTMEKFGIEARYRFVSQDPEDLPDFAPLLRVGVKRDVTVRDIVRVEADLVASYQTGRLHALVDAGMIADIGRNDTHIEFRPSAGVSIRVKGQLRLGAEVYSELSLDDRGTSWAGAGPNIAWTHGRFWLSASYLVGLHKMDNAPRAVWGIAF